MSCLSISEMRKIVVILFARVVFSFFFFFFFWIEIKIFGKDGTKFDFYIREILSFLTLRTWNMSTVKIVNFLIYKKFLFWFWLSQVS